MKKATLYLVVALLVFINVFSAFAETSNTTLNRVVVTFSPLIINNQNYTNKLFDIFNKLTDKNSELAKSWEASGALWLISQNLSGLQVCINSPSDFSNLYVMVESLLIQSLTNAEKLLKEPVNDVKAVERLYSFILKPEQGTFNNNCISICFFDNEGRKVDINEFFKNNKENSILEKIDEDAFDAVNVVENKNENDLPFIKNYSEFYELCNKSNNSCPNIQEVKKPILVKLLFWDDFTPDTFISACLIKNRLIFDTVNKGHCDVELFYNGKGLVLVVYSEVDNIKLFEQHLLMSKKLESAISGIGPKEWQSWSSKLLEVMSNDRRDSNKNVMFEAWLNHWNSKDFSVIPTKSTFVKPNRQENIEVFSSKPEHDFYFSDNTFPSVYACKTDSLDNGANVSICFEAHSHIIEGINNFVKTSLQISVPITIIQKHSENTILSFYCQKDKISTNLSKLKSSITEYLFRKFQITDLRKSIKIGIAGSSSFPAYQLQGLLIEGWPTNNARYESKVAKKDDLYNFVQNSLTDENILKMRWKNLTASPHDKANVLAYLACHNYIIYSWDI